MVRRKRLLECGVVIALARSRGYKKVAVGENRKMAHLPLQSVPDLSETRERSDLCACPNLQAPGRALAFS